MFIDGERAVIEYLTENMLTLVSHGNETIEVHRHHFPDTSTAEGVSVYAELVEVDKDIPVVNSFGMRIIARCRRAEASYALINNVNCLMEGLIQKTLNTTTVACLSNLNSGPSPFIGQNGFYHYSCLYDIIMRNV